MKTLLEMIRYLVAISGTCVLVQIILLFVSSIFTAP